MLDIVFDVELKFYLIQLNPSVKNAMYSGQSIQMINFRRNIVIFAEQCQNNLMQNLFVILAGKKCINN